MFKEIIKSLKFSQDEFTSKVNDSFGDSINEQVYKPVIENVYNLEKEYELAEQKMREINIITMELRMIL